MSVKDFVPRWIQRRDEWEGLTGSAKALWYWKNIQDGALPAPLTIKQAAGRFYDWMERYEWRPAEVDAVCARISDLPVPDGDKHDRFTILPWQASLLAVAHGFYRDDGARAASEVLLIIPRKSGKSSLVAALALNEVARPVGGSRAPQVALAAVSMETARVTFDKCVRIAQFDLMNNKKRGFAGKSRIKSTAKEMRFGKNHGRIFPLSLHARNLEGYLLHLACVDELSNLPSTSPIDTLRSGLGHSENTLTLLTSTYGDLFSAAVDDEVERAQRVLAGDTEGRGVFPFLYTATPDDYPRAGEPELWEEVNPSLGWTVSAEWHADEWEKLRHSVADRHKFYTRQLCAPSTPVVKFVKPADVVEQDAPPANPPRSLCDRWMMGLDLSDTQDFCGICLLGHNSATDKSVAYFWAYAPASALPAREVTNREAMLVRQWENDGHLTVHGENIDHADISARVQALHDFYKPIAILSDTYGALQEVSLRLSPVARAKIRKLSKNAVALAEPMAWMATAVVSGALRVEHHPVFLSHLGNVVLKENSHGGRLPQKATPNSPRRIDMIDAFLMACLAYTRSRDDALLGTDAAPIPTKYERGADGKVLVDAGGNPIPKAHAPLVLGGR